MAQARCGMMTSWDSPMWCCGKADEKDKKENMCTSCPWYKEKQIKNQ